MGLRFPQLHRKNGAGEEQSIERPESPNTRNQSARGDDIRQRRRQTDGPKGNQLIGDGLLPPAEYGHAIHPEGGNGSRIDYP